MRLLAIDPGEMTGWAVFDGRTKVAGGQTAWSAFKDDLANGLGISASRMVQGALAEQAEPFWLGIKPHGPFAGIDMIVMEDFVVYPEGVGDGPPKPWDQLITTRLIGGIQNLADLADIAVEYQPATIKQAGRAAAGDDLLVRPLHPNRHENDATWHGAFYLARNPEAK